MADITPSVIARRTMAMDFQLDVFLYPDEGGWLAHCLQLDLAEWGETLEAAQANIFDVIRAHIESAVEDDDLEHLFHPAPPEVWKRFFEGSLSGERLLLVAPPSGGTFPPVRIREAIARAAA